MGKGWTLVAKLGGVGAKFPHVLVDSNGWCLRLGPKSNKDDKFYSSLQLALRGLVEYFTRRRLQGVMVTLDLKGLVREVEDALHSALTMCQEGVATAKKASHLVPLGGLARPDGKETSPRSAACRPGRLRPLATASDSLAGEHTR